MLIGNKKDLEGDRSVSTIDGQKLKEDYGLDYFIETSAKDGTNVQEIFISASQILYKHFLLTKVRYYIGSIYNNVCLV